MLAGVKYYALGYAALDWLVLIGAVVALRGFRAGAKAGIVSAGLALCGGGYWYVRNWLLTGSPLFPKGLFGANDELGQLYPNMGRSSFLGNGSPELFSLTLEAIWKMTGPLHLAAFCCLPVIICWLLISGVMLWRTSLKRSMGTFRLFIGFLIVGTGVLVVITPFSVEDVPGTLNQLKWAYCPVRYGMSFLSLTVVAFGVFLANLAERLRLSLDSGWKRELPSSTQAAEPNRSRPWQILIGRLLGATPWFVMLTLSAYQIVVCQPKFKGDVIDWDLFAIDGTLLAAILLWLVRLSGNTPGSRRPLRRPP